MNVHLLMLANLGTFMPFNYQNNMNLKLSLEKCVIDHIINSIVSWPC